MASEAQPDMDGPAPGAGMAGVGGGEMLATETRAPGWLRPLRALVGVLLLAVSWAGLMAAILLALNTLAVPPHRHLIVRIALYIVGAIGAAWLGVVALAAVIAGAFCLTLALANRDW